MSIDLQIEERPDYLLAKFFGCGEMAEIWSRFEFIAEQCRRANTTKLLIDYCDASAKLSLVDRFTLGEKYRAFASHHLRVANLARSEQLDSKRMMELVAQNRGVITRVFTEIENAESWLSLDRRFLKD
jgi:hypothetical protein